MARTRGKDNARGDGGLLHLLVRACIPKWENHTNPDYGSIFATGTFSINGTEVGEGHRLYGDGGFKPWSNSIATRDNWEIIKSYMYLEDDLEAYIPRRDANPNIVVVLNNAELVLMLWLDDVAAVLEMLYPSQEGGWTTADLLLGNSVPLDRLSVTYPASLDSTMTSNPDYPERVATDSGNETFSESLNNGYRWSVHTNTSVLFPFGYCEQQQPLLASRTPCWSCVPRPLW
ncbi:Family 3 glycoside hydrolase [Phytophthora cinnamomi]|uniref:Family 3 glycoside hydrolase n=1 Tax=Phytophthora cinnamomi TaxID=4785 RepID=UPI00355A0D93|nr:Family 3 glycoside hydrolase [Phytophthora cinnamomi]